MQKKRDSGHEKPGRRRKEPYQPAIPWDLLDLMQRAVFTAVSTRQPLSDHNLLFQIGQALAYLHSTQSIEWAKHSTRAISKSAKQVWRDATTVKILVEEHGQKVPDAIGYAAPNATDRQRDNIRKRYEKLKAGSAPAHGIVDIKSIEHAIERMKSEHRPRPRRARGAGALDALEAAWRQPSTTHKKRK